MEQDQEQEVVSTEESGTDSAETATEAASPGEAPEAASDSTSESTSDSVGDDSGASPDLDAGSWNGEMDSIESQSWWKEVPETVRDNLRQGIKAKYQNWNQGYTQKLQTLGEQRRAAEQAQKDAEALRTRTLGWLHGGADPLDEKTAELQQAKAKIAELERSHELALTTLRTDHTARLEEAAKKGKAEVERVMQESQQMREEIEGLRADSQLRIEKQTQEAANELQQRIDKDAAYLMKDEHSAAFFEFVSLMKDGRSFEQALRMTEAIHAPPSRPETSNDAEDLMGAGGRLPGGPDMQGRVSVDELINSSRAAAGNVFRLGEDG